MSDDTSDDRGSSGEFGLTLLEEFPALIWRSTTSGVCDWFNKTWLEFTGRTTAQEYGSGWAEGVHPDDLDRCVEIWLANLESRTPFVMDYRLTRHDGEYRWIRDYGRPFNGPDGEFAGFIGACYDITDMRELAVELAFLATHDALTGVPNRSAFETEVARAIAFAGRGTVSSVLFTDVDRFKVCNDQRGHEFGDRLLTEIAKAIAATVREVDFVARIGGDEFAVLLWGQGVEESGEVRRRLAAVVAETGAAHGMDIGLSIGAAAVEAGSNTRRILSEADIRMYEAKRRG